MFTGVFITATNAPALGDVRQLKAGDTIYVCAGWTNRKDVGRYADAITAAVLRGASVVTMAADKPVEIEGEAL